MQRPCLALRTVCAAALVLGLAGCEALVLGTAAGMALAYVRGEGIRKYDVPYEQVVNAVVEAASALHLRDQTVSRGDRRTTVRGRDVDGNRVRIRVYPREDGTQAEVRVRIGVMGEYVPTKIFVDTVNERLGLPPEPDAPRAAG